MKKPGLIWVVPEQEGGIRTYSEELWPFVRDRARESGFDPIEPLVGNVRPEILFEKGAAIIHVQHEFGLFGSKVPVLNRFPAWIRRVRRLCLSSRIIATAHTVLDESYVYPWRGRGWQAPLRWIGNHSVVPAMRRSWIRGTWGLLDGVILHSQLQEKAVQNSGCPRVWVIPHFVSKREISDPGGSTDPVAVVFGYFSPEKAQDVAIRAWAHVLRVSPEARLILAGGVRRTADQAYFDECVELIRKLGLEASIEVTGFVPEAWIDAVYARALVVVAPFRETSGSGSLAQALGRGKAVIASDLPLNSALDSVEPGCLSFFRSEDSEDCARAVLDLFRNEERRRKLRAAASRFAAAQSPESTAERHVKAYLAVLKG